MQTAVGPVRPLVPSDARLDVLNPPEQPPLVHIWHRARRVRAGVFVVGFGCASSLGMSLVRGWCFGSCWSADDGACDSRAWVATKVRHVIRVVRDNRGRRY